MQLETVNHKCNWPGLRWSRKRTRGDVEGALWIVLEHVRAGHADCGAVHIELVVVVERVLQRLHPDLQIQGTTVKAPSGGNSFDVCVFHSRTTQF